ncbi:MAG: TVP38/TMEM64 family protein [Betaproteobacteria bacterium]|nr:MAG: TVP38/TMEM64 family protein [Betaproteobacteria bacterium]
MLDVLSRPLLTLTPPRLALIAAVAALIAAYFALDLQRFLSLQSLKAAQHWFAALYAERPILVTTLFVLTFSMLTALTLPGAAVMMLAAGASFGLLWGSVLSTFASALGATVAMLATRYLFRDAVAKKFAAQIRQVDERIHNDGPYFLMTLRLAPIIPFFVVNWIVGLTGMRTWPFFWSSFVGMFAGTAAYVNAGTQLATVNSFADIFSLPIIASLAALALLPLLLRWVVTRVESRGASRR